MRGHNYEFTFPRKFTIFYYENVQFRYIFLLFYALNLLTSSYTYVRTYKSNKITH